VRQGCCFHICDWFQKELNILGCPFSLYPKAFSWLSLSTSLGSKTSLLSQLILKEEVYRSGPWCGCVVYGCKKPAVVEGRKK
jgi:hypothetical protein